MQVKIFSGKNINDLGWDISRWAKSHENYGLIVHDVRQSESYGNDQFHITISVWYTLKNDLKSIND